MFYATGSSLIAIPGEISGLVASHAGEVRSVARQTRSLVELDLAGCMLVDKRAGVIGGTQLDAFEVALLATEGIIDFGMAHEAIRHLRQVCFARQIGFLETAMARLAGICTVEALTDAGGLA